jgi:hypothetical protein
VKHGPNLRIVIKKSGRNANCRQMGHIAGSHRAAYPAELSMLARRGWIAGDKFHAADEAELRLLHMRVRHKGCTAQLPARGAMAVVKKTYLIGFELNATAKATTSHHGSLLSGEPRVQAAIAQRFATITATSLPQPLVLGPAQMAREEGRSVVSISRCQDAPLMTPAM